MTSHYISVLGHYIDPRRSLVSAIGWLVFTLSISLVLVAGMWVDSLVRTNLLDLRGQELEAAAGDIADELNLSFSLRLQSVRVLAVLLATEMHDANQPSLKTSIGNLRHASPEFERIVLADRRGRVSERTREIERLADQERYAAVARERLKIARDLHDTLAHSMMAMLTEIRLLKRLWTINPEALAEELVSAEETAQQGLKDARAAITQLRFNPVRDAGLSVALGDFVRTFVERSGIPVNYTSDVQAGTFADERAETLFRIAEEAMRNIERHARATSISVTLFSSGDGHGLRLTVCDDGIGFDVEAPHPGHYGLAGLREQANLIGATLTIHSTAQQGTTINVELVPARRFW